ncbi:hypothetical protein QA942_20040 [Streptomyces sp. B21-106]|uniref:hypothetical protein n=1 Tax=Streptomyces sp. B21-106 TaxID=3039418 RepID=UPI002FF0EA24
MAGQGPQRYPGASTAYWYQNRFGGDLMEVNVVVLHTTEGPTLSDYQGGAVAPNLTAVPDFAAKRLKWYQHFDIDRSSRALVNLAGGVETNTLNVCQVELVGTCDPATHKKWTATGQAHIYWPEAPDWALTELAVFLRWMNTQHGVPLTGPSKWPAYPASYASAAGQRMTGAQWSVFKGVCGHMHVPENVHGDPGAIDFDGLLALAKGDKPVPPPPTQPPAVTPGQPGIPAVLTEVAEGGPALKAGEWTLLKMAADSAIAQGPCTYTVACYVTVTGTPGTRVIGRFHDLPLATGRPSADLPQDGGVIGKDGTLNAVFTRPGALDAKEQLKLEVMADAPATVTYRLLRGLRWNT